MKKRFLKVIFAISLILSALSVNSQSFILSDIFGNSLGIVSISDFKEIKTNSAFTGFDLYKKNGEIIQNITKINVDLLSNTEDQMALGKFSIFPTLVEDEIVISGISFSAEIKIFDINGKLVYENVICNDFCLNSMFNPGVYFVNIKEGNKNQTFKIIKK